ncbi:MAG: ABC transporter substrate-binding protein [Kineosporiaceae bacterium]
MTDFKRYDRVRRSASPLQLDLVEAFGAGRVSRREFVRLGLMLGMTTAALAACGGTDTPSSGSTSAATEVGVGGGGAVKVQQGGTIKIAGNTPASTGLDSVTMIDLATYNAVGQSYEYLCTTGGDLKLIPQLADSWTPNADGTEWTFKLRTTAKWGDGSAFTSADVVETMERLVKAGNSGLKGIVASGSTTAPDPATAVFKLSGPNGNFPYLVSSDNPQSAINPKALPPGTTLDKSTIGGTGPWKLEKFDPKTGATFVRNDAWWGGKTPLDKIEWSFFDDLQAQIVAVQSGQVDAIVQFQIIGGQGLLKDPNLNVIKLRTASHREVWMRCDTGQFKDPKVRQALGYTLDRQALVQTLFQGSADVGNDNVFAPVYPYTDAAVPQRPRDVAKAKALLAEAGVTGPLKAELNCGKLQEIPDLAALMKNNAAEAGFDLTISVQDQSSFYTKSWCDTSKTPPCDGNAELGIVDYGHRATPDVYLNAALATGGVWNSSHYASTGFDTAFKAFQSSIGLDAQKVAASKLQQILLDESPILIPYFYNYLAAHSKKYAGLSVTGLGQLSLAQAGLV